MKIQEVQTYVVQIFIAGDFQVARNVCKKYCDNIGLCVTIEPTEYIYTGGSENGVRIGLINYPRFPTSEDKIWQIATNLANILKDELCQTSFSILDSNKTIWHSWRAYA
jgi:hypothetical protein